MGNCKDHNDFFKGFRFLVDELHRVMMPGRVVAVHCMDLPTYKRNGDEIGIRDFPGDIIRCFVDRGFTYHCPRITIWKDPLIAATRTKAIGLAHKQLVKDSAMSRTGIPDCIVCFRKKGENPKPISHPKGLTEYHGSRAVPSNLNGLWSDLKDGITPDKDKRAHWIWQQYASPVWFDIRQTKVLQHKKAREADDEKHVCPLQIDVIERCIALWSTTDDVVLTPFLGVGSEIYVAVKNKRKGIGIELKPSYFRQAVKNVESALKAVEIKSLV